jgi:hypothetical protein
MLMKRTRNNIARIASSLCLFLAACKETQVVKVPEPTIKKALAIKAACKAFEARYPGRIAFYDIELYL